MTTLIASIAGAPGVSTLVAALAAATTPERPLLAIEAASSGGVVATRWHWPRSNSVAAAALDTVADPDLWDLATPWLGGSRILLGDPSLTATRHAQIGGWLADHIDTVTPPVLIDGGRLVGTPDQEALLAGVEDVWVLLDPTADQITAAMASRRWLAMTGRVGLLSLERSSRPGRYAPDEAAATLGWPLVSTVPFDPDAAAVLCGYEEPKRTFQRSPLLRTGRMLADLIAPTEGMAA